ncbi:type VI secretion system baseplate subunit TssK [Erwinia sorbitola]|uniref:Type VI secretion system baseplate subunit TssK n=1 Tax=Erwinia sorbitola TaxID=2681984 RepID=A0A6I6EJC8_9GAMM|nr:type VI secretion system baseplate subunit TssK [Erwinia sorbitola]MTD26531.1 type VI secretion system baseplate subunit TssK [Erwinia sorbitola]QGU88115.1 type VI secretion system baseplate subunit TssK [Erwinia sorbitola]
MRTRNRVIWREGLFVKPQHFQQQQRHNDYQLQCQINALRDYNHGFSSLSINQELLQLGRIGLSAASGIMTDGTVFNIPYQDYAPKPLDILHCHDAASRDIYLALPIHSDALNEVIGQQSLNAGAVRYRENREDIRDLHTEGGDVSQLVLAQLVPKLMQGSEDLSAWATLPLCRIREKRPDGSLILENEFIPTCTTLSVSKQLKDFMDEVQGSLVERARALSLRIGSPGQQGIADVAEFMMLQVFNRLQPLFTHLAAQSVMHPQDFYCHLIQACGELRTFTDESRLAGEFTGYNHDNLTDSFQPLFRAVRQVLSTVLTPRAFSIQLQPQAHGIRVATINDSSLLRNADFVLAVRAQIPLEQLRRQFVQQTKITSLEKIRDLVSVQLPGVPLQPLSAAPRQLPYHSGYTYFMLDRHSAAWKEIQQSNAIAFHVAGDFPELDMQFWAIRSNE